MGASDSLPWWHISGRERLRRNVRLCAICLPLLLTSRHTGRSRHSWKQCCVCSARNGRLSKTLQFLKPCQRLVLCLEKARNSNNSPPSYIALFRKLGEKLP